MAAFSDTVRAQMAGRAPAFAVLGFFDFLGDPQRLWLGAGPLLAGGHLWKGLGQFAAISGIEQPIGGSAPVATFTLSGVDVDLLGHVRAAKAEVRGRDVTLFLQAFEPDSLALLDAPYAFYAGIMDAMALVLSGPDTATIELTAESIFARTAFAPWAQLADRDQKRLFPGDRGLEGIAQIPFKKPTWPVITVTSK